MKNPSLNKSILAMVLAASATTTAAPQPPILGMNQPTVNTYTDKSVLYSLAFLARYKDAEKGLVEGKIFLRLYKSKLKPSYLNQITAEYEGYFYFESNEKLYGDYALHASVGGEDDQIILDLVNVPAHDATYLPKVYNMHGCNSTNTDCAPMTMQYRVFKDGTIELQGKFVEGLQVFIENEWQNEVFHGKLVREIEKN
jgi:hypothetical protein